MATATGSAEVLTRNHVQITGNQGAAQTIVLIHGFGSDQTSFRFVASAFAAHYRLVLFDQAGHGERASRDFDPVRYGSLHGYADDLLEICDALALKSAVVIGQSVGGIAASLASVKRPGLFEKLVLIGTSPRYLNDADYVGGFEQPDIDGIYQAIATNFFAWLRGLATMAMRNPEQPLLATEFAQSLARMSPDVALVLMRTIMNMDHRRDLSQIEVPVLLIQPQDDVFVPPEVGEYLRRTIKQSTLRPISAQGHFPHLSAPDQVIEAIRAFL